MFNWIKRIFNRKQQSNGHLTEEDRAKALAFRRQQWELNQLEKQAIVQKRMNMLERAISESSGTNKSEEMMLSLLMSFLQKPQQQQQTPNIIYGLETPNTPQQTQQVTLNKEQTIQTAQYIKQNFPKPLLSQLSSLTEQDLLNVRKELIK